MFLIVRRRDERVRGLSGCVGHVPGSLCPVLCEGSQRLKRPETSALSASFQNQPLSWRFCRPTGRTIVAGGAATLWEPATGERPIDAFLWFFPARLRADLSTGPRSQANAKIVRPQPGGIPKQKPEAMAAVRWLARPRRLAAPPATVVRPKRAKTVRGNASWPRRLNPRRPAPDVLHTP
jgi:hypothetical protein